MNLEELKREWITKQYGTKACDCPTCVAYITALEAECERLRVKLELTQVALNNAVAAGTQYEVTTSGGCAGELSEAKEGK